MGKELLYVPDYKPYFRESHVVKCDSCDNEIVYHVFATGVMSGIDPELIKAHGVQCSHCFGDLYGIGKSIGMVHKDVEDER